MGTTASSSRRESPPQVRTETNLDSEPELVWGLNSNIEQEEEQETEPEASSKSTGIGKRKRSTSSSERFAKPKSSQRVANGGVIDLTLDSESEEETLQPGVLHSTVPKMTTPKPAASKSTTFTPTTPRQTTTPRPSITLKPFIIPKLATPKSTISTPISHQTPSANKTLDSDSDSASDVDIFAGTSMARNYRNPSRKPSSSKKSINVSMSNNMGKAPPELAARRCASCIKLKRKCSKTLPQCTHCKRTSRDCTYPSASVPSKYNALLSKETKSESPYSSRATTARSVSAVDTTPGGSLEVPRARAVSQAESASSLSFSESHTPSNRLEDTPPVSNHQLLSTGEELQSTTARKDGSSLSPPPVGSTKPVDYPGASRSKESSISRTSPPSETLDTLMTENGSCEETESLAGDDAVTTTSLEDVHIGDEEIEQFLNEELITVDQNHQGSSETTPKVEGVDSFLIPQYALDELATRKRAKPEVSDSEPRDESAAVEEPSFLNPQSSMIYLKIDGHLFAIYADFLQYHSPLLYTHCSHATTPTTAATPPILAPFDHKIIALLIQWLYTSPSYPWGLINKTGEITYQNRLIKLWVLGGKLQMRRLQKDVLRAVKDRVDLDGCLELRSMKWLWENTGERDCMRELYLGFLVGNWGVFESGVLEKLVPEGMRGCVEGRVQEGRGKGRG